MPHTTQSNQPIRYRVAVNSGFITNSSSCVHWFDRRVLKDPDVKQFLAKYEITDGEVGSCLLDRSKCGSFIPNAETHKEAVDSTAGEEYGPPLKQDYDEQQVITIYGDEYQTVFSILTELLRKAAERLKVPHTATSYN